MKIQQNFYQKRLVEVLCYQIGKKLLSTICVLTNFVVLNLNGLVYQEKWKNSFKM